MSDRPRTLRFRCDDGLELEADAFGDPEAPCVLFQHGGGQTRYAWGGTAAALARQGWHAITLDLRGHGASGWSADGAYALHDYARDAITVAEAVGQPPVLVGASLGGISGLLATTLTEGAAFAGLVLVDVTPRMDPEGVQRIAGFMTEHMHEGFASLDEAADAIARYLPHRPRPPSTEGLRKNLRLGEDGRYRWHWDPMFMTTREEGPSSLLNADTLCDAARALTLPTLLVRGRMSELVSEDHAQEFLEMAPHARFADVSGAGHMVAGDRNDAFTEAVVDFLDELRANDAA